MQSIDMKKTNVLQISNLTNNNIISVMLVIDASC